ncbi:MAG: hypothetical protein NXY57DRAFT_1044883, partial [Lentinula lateritia]
SSKQSFTSGGDLDASYTSESYNFPDADAVEDPESSVPNRRLGYFDLHPERKRASQEMLGQITIKGTDDDLLNLHQLEAMLSQDADIFASGSLNGHSDIGNDIDADDIEAVEVDMPEQFLADLDIIEAVFIRPLRESNPSIIKSHPGGPASSSPTSISNPQLTQLNALNSTYGSNGSNGIHPYAIGNGVNGGSSSKTPTMYRRFYGRNLGRGSTNQGWYGRVEEATREMQIWFYESIRTWLTYVMYRRRAPREIDKLLLLSSAPCPYCVVGATRENIY